MHAANGNGSEAGIGSHAVLKDPPLARGPRFDTRNTEIVILQKPENRFSVRRAEPPLALDFDLIGEGTSRSASSPLVRFFPDSGYLLRPVAEGRRGAQAWASHTRCVCRVQVACG